MIKTIVVILIFTMAANVYAYDFKHPKQIKRSKISAQVNILADKSSEVATYIGSLKPPKWGLENYYYYKRNGGMLMNGYVMVGYNTHDNVVIIQARIPSNNELEEYNKITKGLGTPHQFIEAGDQGMKFHTWYFRPM